MRRVILSLLILLSVSIGYAQKKNVTKARNLALMETPDFKAAREAIKEALEEPTTKDDPRTWHVAGLIGYKENEEYYKQMALGKTVDFVKKGNAVIESMNYLIKAYELDQNQVNKKGQPVKPKYEKDIKDKLKEYFNDKTCFFFPAATLFDEKKDYEGAMKIFDAYLSINELPYMKGQLTLDSTYYQSKYFNAIAARNADKWDRAIEIHESMKGDNYETSNVYKMLYEEYVEVKDTVNFLKTLEEGFELMPDDPWFIQNLINYFISNNRLVESKSYVDKAIAVSPEEAVYYYIYGKIYEIEKDYDQARSYYRKTIELDSSFADAYAGLGFIIVDEAQIIMDEAAYKSDKEFNLAKKNTETMYKEAVDYFKKADELNPEELTYKRNLKNLYYRLNMSKELDEVEKALGY